MRRSIFRPMLLGACLTAPLLLAGCGGDEGVPQTFPPLRYNYLAPISLNVANIQTVVNYAPAPGGSSMDAQSPEPPLQAVQQMIQDRLVAGGAGGTAVITINAASLNQVNDTVVGNVSLRLTVTSADGRQRGFTDASVSRTRTMPSDTSQNALNAFLYAMTQDLVNAENVELEYQIRQNLPAWLVGGGAGASVIGGPSGPTPVQAVPLGGPGSAPTVVPMTGAAAPATLGTPAVQPLPDNTPSMPGGGLGLPEGNPVPQDQYVPAVTPTPATPGAPTSLNPAMPATATPAAGVLGTMPVSSGGSAAPAAAPAPAPAPKPAPKPAASSSSSSSSSSLPPLPAGITP